MTKENLRGTTHAMPLKNQFLIIMLVATVVGIAIAAAARHSLSEADSTRVVMGVGLSWINILFYSVVAAIILVKKNVAWGLTLIVIKYVILVSFIYYIWASADVVMVVVGVISELVLTSCLLLPLKRFIFS